MTRRPRYLEEDRGYETPCWIWQLGVDKWGYGKSGNRGAHRVFYERLVGPVPEGLQLDHLCRVRDCVNPAHLEPVTAAENIRRGMVARGVVPRPTPPTDDLRPLLEEGVRAAKLWVTHARLSRIYGLPHGRVTRLRAPKLADALDARPSELLLPAVTPERAA